LGVTWRHNYENHNHPASRPGARAAVAAAGSGAADCPSGGDEELQQRVQELAGRANEGTLTPDEQREYEAYVDAGDIVATLEAVARKTLQAVAG